MSFLENWFQRGMTGFSTEAEDTVRTSGSTRNMLFRTLPMCCRGNLIGDPEDAGFIESLNSPTARVGAEG